MNRNRSASAAPRPLAQIRGFRLSVLAAALAAAAPMGADAFARSLSAQLLAAPLVGQHSVGSIIAARRAASTAANVPAPMETLYLRRRADYASEAEMIDQELAILRDEIATLRRFNLSAEQDLSAMSASIAETEEEQLAAKRREVRTLRRTLNAERAKLRERLEATEGELRTTRRLREGASESSDDALETWRARERELEKERDRLRTLLEQVSQLAALVN